MFQSWWQDLQKYRNQYKAIFVVNIISLAHGSATGWLSPSLPVLQSDDTHLVSGPISMEELSWIGGLLSLGGIVGNFMFSAIAGKFGRKFALILLAFPNLAFWMLLVFSKYVEHLYAARLFAGFTGGGLFVVLPVFVAEIADPTVRGKLNGFMSLVVSIGVLCGYILVEILPSNYIAYVMSFVPILYLLCVVSLPETPDFLLKVGKFEEAKSAVWFYKSYDYQSPADSKKLFDEDVNAMRQLVVNVEQGISSSKITAADFCKFPNPIQLEFHLQLILIDL